ncbi:uncharacterized protein V6R79_013307 [Siganus canaliculatus]
MEDYISSVNNTNSTLDINTVVDYIVVSLGIPLSAVAVYVLYSLVRHGHAPAPVYIINLLISDIIQICCIIASLRPFFDLRKLQIVFFCLYVLCLFASVAFMVCIALERYFLVAWPLWYHFKRPTRIPVVVSVLVWIFCLVVSFLPSILDFELESTIHGVLFLLPIPIFIFCLAGTLRALSASRLPADEKRRIVAVLVLVLLIYTLLFLPAVISLLERRWFIFDDVPSILVKLNPLADLVLYIFMRKGVVDKLLASVSCCKLNCCKSDISNI